MRLRRCIIAGHVALAGCATGSSTVGAPAPDSEPTAGVLVMAHGGSAEWNASVEAAIGPLRAKLPAELAFGMADPATLQRALDSLASRGVQRVAVVRMFLTGSSFLYRTEYLLGLTDGPAPRPMSGMDHGELHPLLHSVQIATHTEGIADARVIPDILRDRAAELSSNPPWESVLVIAHGLGDDRANDSLLARMEDVVEPIRSMGFRDVRAATLREDWDAKRAQAEAEIRSYVTQQLSDGVRVLVIPFRLSGFGPYASVLEGLSYEEGRGLLPHPTIAQWVEETAARVLCSQGWMNPLMECGQRQ